MGRFNVSRATVREALLSLQQKGIVNIKSGQRIRVTKSNMETLVAAMGGAVNIYLSEEQGIRNFQALRKTLEVAVARSAAGTVKQNELERIENALDLNRLARGESEQFIQTDILFHLEIIRSSHNPLLVGVYQALTGWLTEQRKQVLSIEGAEQVAFDAHKKIFEGLADRDKDRAEQAMARHMDAVIAEYWNVTSMTGGQAGKDLGPVRS